jgi:pimeloyl-ACP methyl ester carboxylesterase
LLADRYHVVAPDLPGFGFTVAPDRTDFTYSFDTLAKVIGAFTDAIGLKRFAIYVFDYGAPVGFRLALAHPDRVTAIISQNGNAYEEGLSSGWSPIQRYWQDPTPANRKELRSFLAPETTKWQYTHGVANPAVIAPESYTLDSALLSRPGNDEIQLDLFLDYAKQRRPLSQVPGLLCRAHATFARGVGQERSVLSAAWRGGVQARQPQCRGAFLRHWPFCTGDPRRGNRERDPGIPGPRRGVRQAERRIGKHRLDLTPCRGHCARALRDRE